MKLLWKQKFSDRIRSRGFDYYKRKKVCNVEIEENLFQADVEGSEFYHVIVETSQTRIRFMDCTCPYAQDSHFCKHMAALFYELEDRGIISEDALNEQVDSFVSAAKKQIDREVNAQYASLDRLAYMSSIRVMTYIKNHLHHTKPEQTFQILTYCLQQIIEYEEIHRERYILLTSYCIEELTRLVKKNKAFCLDIQKWVDYTIERKDSYVCELLKNGQFEFNK